jgi:chromosome segregation ATPase
MEAAIGGFIRDHVQSLERRTGDIEGRLDTAEQVTADLGLSINAADSKAQQLASHISSAGDLVKAMAETNGECRASLKAMQDGAEAAQAIKTEIDNLGESVTGDIKHAGLNAQNVLRDLLNRVEDGVAGANHSVEAIRSEQATLQSVIHEATETARAAGKTVEFLKSHVESMEDRCDTAQHHVADMVTKFEQTIARTEADLEQRLRDADDQVARHADAFNATIGKRFQEADTRFATVREELKQTIDDRIAEADDRVARQLEDAQRQISEQSADVRGRIEQAIEELRTSIDARMNALTAQSNDLQTTQKELLAASETARKQVEKVDAQAEIARELLSEQSRRSEDHRRLVTELAEQVAKGEAITSHFEGIKDGALEAYAQLAERSEVAATLFERTSELELQIEQREQDLEAQGHALAAFSEEREAIELRIQQLVNSTDSLRVELGSLLSDPQKLVCEAKAQALQLNDVCRAVKKVFAGLSQASLEANRKIDELRRLETVATALQGWVNETANTQRRLTTALAPALADPEPVVATVERQARPANTPVVAMPQPVPAKAASEANEKIAAAAAAVQKSKSHQIDKLIREARRKAVPSPAEAGPK